MTNEIIFNENGDKTIIGEKAQQYVFEYEEMRRKLMTWNHLIAFMGASENQADNMACTKLISQTDDLLDRVNQSRQVA